MNIPIITDLSSFNPQKINLQKLSNTYVNVDIYAIKYKENNLVVELPSFKLTKYGIPLSGHLLTHPGIMKCIKVPIDPTQASCCGIKELIDKIENKVKTTITIPKNNYTFMPIINKDYWIPKFLYDKTNHTLETPIYIVENGIPKIKNIAKISDLNKYIGKNPNIRMIVSFYVWVSTNKTFGMTVKIMQMEITPGVPELFWSKIFSQYAFTKKNINQPKNVESIVDKKITENDLYDDDDDDDGEGS
jgi:hypothetical protein